IFGAHAGRLAHAVAKHLAAAEFALVAIDGVIAFDLSVQVSVGQAHFVAGGRAENVSVNFSRQAVAHGCSLWPKPEPTAFAITLVRLASSRAPVAKLSPP